MCPHGRLQLEENPSLVMQRTVQVESLCPHKLGFVSVAPCIRCFLHPICDLDDMQCSFADTACLSLIEDQPLASAAGAPQAGLGISGINAEVMPGQWEFQIGPVGPLEVGDQVCLPHLSCGKEQELLIMLHKTRSRASSSRSKGAAHEAFRFL